MTAKGYVFCDQHRFRGRITSWGKNVSVKCAVHGCSKAKGRAKVTDGQLAEWLRRGVEEVPVVLGDPKAAQRRHEAMFAF